MTELGTKANPHRDRIAIDGKPLRASAPPATYILLHKPVGVMTTLADPEGRSTVRDLLTGVRQRVFPVGRLDYHSAGLLLLTNDGELALRLTHPRYGVRKTYQVKVKGEPQPAQLQALARGVRLPDGMTNPATVHVATTRNGKAWLAITLAEGKNRQVRRMCERVGLPVEKLVRVAFGPLRLGKLPPGHWRHLTEPEVEQLRHASPDSVARTPPPRPGRRRRADDADRPRPDRPRPDRRDRAARGGARPDTPAHERPRGPGARRVTGGVDREDARPGAPRRARDGRSHEPRERSALSPRPRPPRGRTRQDGEAAPPLRPRRPRGAPAAPPRSRRGPRPRR